MEHFFNPRAIAVVGASPDPQRVGGRVMHYLLDYGYEGAVYPVNPRYNEIRGLACYGSVSAIPDVVDVAMICVAAEAVPDVVRQCGARQVELAIIHADGFGDRNGEIYGQLLAARDESGVRLVGPNTVGLRAVNSHMFTETGGGLAEIGYRDGPLAVIGQSGGLITYFGATYLDRRGIGARYVLDTGNECDLDIADMLGLVSEDPDIRAVGLIIEGVGDGRKLVSAIRRASERGTRVYALRLGRSEAGATAAISHTGNIAGSAQVFEEIMHAAGTTLCARPGDLANALVLSAHGLESARSGVGVVTPSGGFGVLALDLAVEYGVSLPTPTVPPPAALAAQLGQAAARNPIDINAGRPVPGFDTFDAAVRQLLAQPDIQCVVCWLPYHLVSEPPRGPYLADLLALAPIAHTAAKCLVVCGRVHRDTEPRLADAGILCVDKPEELFAAVGLIESGAGQPVVGATAQSSLTADHGGPVAEARSRVISGPIAQACIEEAGVPFVATRELSSVALALEMLADVGTLFLKVEGGVAHKTDLGLVAGPLRSASEVEHAWSVLGSRAADLDNALVVGQAALSGIEMVIGGFRDPSFGPIVMVGRGGGLVETDRDVAFALAPLDQSEARDLIGELRASRLLAGYRGSEPADIGALARSLAALSRAMCSESFDYSEVDVNPIFVGPNGKGAYAVDCILVKAPSNPVTLRKGTNG